MSSNSMGSVKITGHLYASRDDNEALERPEGTYLKVETAARERGHRLGNRDRLERRRKLGAGSDDDVAVEVRLGVVELGNAGLNVAEVLSSQLHSGVDLLLRIVKVAGQNNVCLRSGEQAQADGGQECKQHGDALHCHCRRVRRVGVDEGKSKGADGAW